MQDRVRIGRMSFWKSMVRFVAGGSFFPAKVGSPSAPGQGVDTSAKEQAMTRARERRRMAGSMEEEG
jgi:hypothetical protein